MLDHVEHLREHGIAVVGIVQAPEEWSQPAEARVGEFHTSYT